MFRVQPDYFKKFEVRRTLQSSFLFTSSWKTPPSLCEGDTFIKEGDCSPSEKLLMSLRSSTFRSGFDFSRNDRTGRCQLLNYFIAFFRIPMRFHSIHSYRFWIFPENYIPTSYLNPFPWSPMAELDTLPIFLCLEIRTNRVRRTKDVIWSQ